MYDHVEKKLSYYLGERSTGSYGRRAHISIPLAMIDEQINGGSLTMSGPFGGPGGATFQGERLLSMGINSLAATAGALSRVSSAGDGVEASSARGGGGAVELVGRGGLEQGLEFSASMPP